MGGCDTLKHFRGSGYVEKCCRNSDHFLSLQWVSFVYLFGITTTILLQSVLLFQSSEPPLKTSAKKSKAQAGPQPGEPDSKAQPDAKTKAEAPPQTPPKWNALLFKQINTNVFLGENRSQLSVRKTEMSINKPIQCGLQSKCLFVWLVVSVMILSWCFK